MAPFIAGVFSAPVSRHLTPAVPHLGRRAWCHARPAAFLGSLPLSALTALHLPLRCPTPGWKSLAPPRQLQRGPRALMFTPCLCLLSFPLPSCSATGSTAGVGVGEEKGCPSGQPQRQTCHQSPLPSCSSFSGLSPAAPSGALLAQRPLAHHALS